MLFGVKREGTFPQRLWTEKLCNCPLATKNSTSLGVHLLLKTVNVETFHQKYDQQTTKLLIVLRFVVLYISGLHIFINYFFDCKIITSLHPTYLYLYTISISHDFFWGCENKILTQQWLMVIQHYSFRLSSFLCGTLATSFVFLTCYVCCEGLVTNRKVVSLLLDNRCSGKEGSSIREILWIDRCPGNFPRISLQLS